MIRGRPTNLWLGLTTSVFGAIGVTLIVLGVDPAVVGTLISAYTGVAGAVITVIAGQPPTLNPGDQINVTTPKGQPTATATVAAPPAADAPPATGG
jgi:hypothetical protein